jgi:hypothetical protein
VLLSSPTASMIQVEFKDYQINTTIQSQEIEAKFLGTQ